MILAYMVNEFKDHINHQTISNIFPASRFFKQENKEIKVPEGYGINMFDSDKFRSEF